MLSRLKKAMLTNDESGPASGNVIRAQETPSVPPVGFSDWSWCGARVPKNQVTYMTQVVLVYCIIAVALSQLILQSSDRELWLVLLSTSVGYVLPSPKLKFLKPSVCVTSTATATTAAATTSVLPSLSTVSIEENRSSPNEGSSSMIANSGSP